MFTRTSPSTGPASPRVDGFYEPDTGSVQFVVSDPATKQAALIDIVQDFDPASGSTAFRSAQTALDFVRDNGLTVAWILDTHPHADHMMAQHWLKEQTGAPTGIGEKVRDIAGLWAGFYHLPDAFDPDRDFDHLFADGDTFKLGNLDVQVILSPGHTLGSITYVIGDAAFVHDTFMHVDAGTTRADFPGGSSAELYASLQRLLELPDNTRLFVGHDYPPVGDRKDPAWEATVADHRAHNKHIGGGVSEADFRKLRDARDATLNLPDRMLQALQVNLRGGRMPDPESDGRSYFKIPANYFPERNA
ncbi:MBL fold metallo-hydrolase [Puniceibacterium sediminis]|uniref:Glyoxylase, beta-lactamase superfamily II n=1 Tax=Puniceibacterium sediminis TaxID=1608407 RepID=A0A238WRC5_9RHOB|nr:MBL fold metallo-hydrolase [Puniceibacterium sediminis]SNR49065.1 Glyoxylase, beta-lactamase superfamily II [Puniceibacterium sediminis]